MILVIKELHGTYLFQRSQLSVSQEIISCFGKEESRHYARESYPESAESSPHQDIFSSNNFQFRFWMPHVLPPCILKYNPGTFLTKIQPLKGICNWWCTCKRETQDVLHIKIKLWLRSLMQFSCTNSTLLWCHNGMRTSISLPWISLKILFQLYFCGEYKINNSCYNAIFSLSSRQKQY